MVHEMTQMCHFMPQKSTLTPLVGTPLLSLKIRGILSEWLVHGMRQAGLTQSALAAKARVSRSTVGRILRRAVDADDTTLDRLARAMHQPLPDVGAAQWATGEDDRPRYSQAGVGGAQDEQAERAQRVADAVARFVRRNDLMRAPAERLVDFLKAQVKWANDHDLDPGDLWELIRTLKQTQGK